MEVYPWEGKNSLILLMCSMNIVQGGQWRRASQVFIKNSLQCAHVDIEKEGGVHIDIILFHNKPPLSVMLFFSSLVGLVNTGLKFCHLV